MNDYSCTIQDGTARASYQDAICKVLCQFVPVINVPGITTSVNKRSMAGSSYTIANARPHWMLRLYPSSARQVEPRFRERRRVLDKQDRFCPAF